MKKKNLLSGILFLGLLSFAFVDNFKAYATEPGYVVACCQNNSRVCYLDGIQFMKYEPLTVPSLETR
ncbi:MAG: hypothetical protein ACP5DQ_02810 [Bacteroidales bacterium]